MVKGSLNASKPESLGQFEQFVLAAVYLLEGDGYTVTITLKVEELMRRRVMVGAVYSSLDRLERRGLILSWFVDPEKRRGAHAKRCFKITAAGVAALDEWKVSARIMLDALGEAT